MFQHTTRALALSSLIICSPAYAAGLTQSSNEFAVSAGYYRYEEPGLMSLQGLKSGAELRLTKAFPAHRTFLRGEFRYAGGTVDYTSKSTGSKSGEPDWYVEGRVLFGSDWLLDSATVSNHIGLGYRFLLNDGRGITTTNAAGYRRESNYIYLPMGLTYITDLKSGNTFKTMVEYDHLLMGKQFSQLSDTNLGYSDLNNKQHSGYGIKLRATYAARKWFVGPYLHYWNIAASETQPLYRHGSYVGYGLEPKNQTTEFGVEYGRPF